MPEEKVLPVKVVLRARPLIAKEINEGCQKCLTFTPGEPQVVLGADKAFTYDYVFDPDTPQIKVYEESVKTLVDGIFKGYNATVLAYGQTGSGKTYCMGGAYDRGNDDETIKGLIPRVIEELFIGVNRRKEKHDFTIKVSYLEIYNEDVLDLLVPPAARVKDAVAIRERTDGGIRLTGLEEKLVTSMSAMIECLEEGAQSRTTGATAMNSTSSRSHAIFTIHVDRKNKTDCNDYFHAKFHLVDLAGSERQKRTNAEGDRFKEGVNINRGLLALGNVISALGEDNSKRHIPYRDSKITRLLQDSLGGNSNTVMIACVSPADSNFEETLSTLRYADRARKIKNKAVVNRDPQAAEIMRLKAMVAQLQQQVQANGGTVTIKADVSRSSLDSSIDTSLLKQVIEKLEEENGKLKTELVNAIHQNTAMYEKMVSVETINDKLKDHLAKLREKTGLSLSVLEGNPEMQAKIKEIQDEVTEMETIHESCLNESTTTEDKTPTDNDESIGEKDTSRRSGPSDANFTTEDVLKEAQLKNKMYELNDQLAQKEALLKEINSNNTTFSVFHDKFEAELKERELKILELQQEKESLSEKLSSAKAAVNSKKVAEQRRQRVKELETHISSLQRQNKDQAKLLKMKESTAKDSQRLASEILELKKVRLGLIKQMRAESEASRKWKQKKEKEVLQLKAKERKQKAEMSKLERQNTQQQQVLRRKVQEASAANRRLQDALQKQKSVAIDRCNKQERHNNVNQDKMMKWLNNELELLVSVEENRHHLNLMVSQRKELNSRLTSLKDEMEVPPTKKKMLGESLSKESDEYKTGVSENIREVERDLQHLNTQISETQQRIMEVDQDEKSKSRWDCIRTLMDARCALGLLLEKAARAKTESLEETSKAVEANANLDEKNQEVVQLELKINALKDVHNKQVTTIHQESQQRMAPLLLLLNQKVLSQADVDKALQLSEDGILRFTDLQDVLVKESEKVDNLNRKLLKNVMLEKKGHTSFFGHLDSTPKLEDLPSTRARKPTVLVENTPGFNDDMENDPNWTPTVSSKPVGRSKRGHQSLAFPTYSTDSDGDEKKSNTSLIKCACKKDACSSKRCRCRKNGGQCGDGCLCDEKTCQNKDHSRENASGMNSTFTMDNSGADSSIEEPKRRSGVKRNSSGQPLSERNRRITYFDSADSSLNSTDDFMDATFSNRKRIKKPFFDAPTPPN